MNASIHIRNNALILALAHLRAEAAFSRHCSNRPIDGSVAISIEG
jgi:hypothetical protein